MAKIIDHTIWSADTKRKILQSLKDRAQARFNDAERRQEYEWIDATLQFKYKTNKGGEIIARQVSNRQPSNPSSESSETVTTINQTKDVYSDLFLPVLYSIFQAVMVNLKEFIFPVDSDWFGFNMTNSAFFEKLQLRHFVKWNNRAWRNLIKTENEVYDFLLEYHTALMQNCAYGGTVINHYYDNDSTVVDFTTLNIQDFALDPPVGKWKNSNKIIRTLVTYFELKHNPDYDQRVVSMLNPIGASDGTDRRDMRELGPSEVARLLVEEDLPEGNFLVYEFSMRNFFFDDDSGKPVVEGERIHITCLFDAEVKTDIDRDDFDFDDYESENDFILCVKALEWDNEDGIVYAKYGTTMPNVAWHKGVIAPLLDHQVYVNQLFSGMSRKTAINANPPLTKAPQSHGSTRRTEILPLDAGVIYPEISLIPVFPQGLNIDVDRVVIEFYIENMEKAAGVTAFNQGGRFNTRRTATEVTEASQGADARLSDAAIEFDKRGLKPSLIQRVQLTQYYLRRQVEEALEDELTPEQLEVFTTDRTAVEDGEFDEILDEILPNVRMFERIKSQSRIVELYQEFYKQNERMRIQKEELQNEINIKVNLISQMKVQLSTQIMQNPTEDFTPPLVQDPQTGVSQLAVPPDQLPVLIENHIAAKRAGQQSMASEIHKVQTEVDLMRAALKEEIGEVPEASDSLFFKLFTHPLNEGDIVITGSSANQNRQIERDNADVFLGILNNVPQVGRFFSDEKLAEMLSRAVNVNFSDVAKSQDELAREELTAKQEQALQQMIAQQGGAPNAQAAR